MKYAAIISSVLSVLLLCTTFSYRYLYQDAHGDLVALREDVRQLNDTAEAKLKTLTAERDEKQARLNAQAADQEKKDASALSEIARLAGELEHRPVRVRYLTAPGGQSGGVAQGQGAVTASAGAGSAAAATGVLPEPNARRLGLALTEVEKLSAAYTSCRATLLGQAELAQMPTKLHARLTASL